VICADCFTHQGKVPAPDCFKTFGLLGADISASTFQTGEPFPVIPHVQSSGSVPSVTASKFSTAANATLATSIIAIDRASVMLWGRRPYGAGAVPSRLQGSSRQIFESFPSMRNLLDKRVLRSALTVTV